MPTATRFRIRAGELVYEVEGPEDFVAAQIARQREHIQAILDEQMKLMRSGKFGTPKITRGRRGRPPKEGSVRRGASGRRPGRQPVIVRESSLMLKPRQLAGLRKFLMSLAGEGKLGKDAVVFGIAYFLGSEVLRKDVFSAGDVMAAFEQLGKLGFAPPAGQVDVVQMLRNLAAASIGKEWVRRNTDGTFALTSKGKSIGASGKVVRPRGRRPASRATARAKKSGGKSAAKKKAR